MSLPDDVKADMTARGDSGGPTDDALARLLLLAVRRGERAHERATRAEARAQAERAAAREFLRKVQNLEAEAFRLRDCAAAARLDADESYARILDLEDEVRAERVHGEELGRHLQEALATHLRDDGIWRTLVDEQRAHAGMLTSQIDQLRAQIDQLRSDAALAALPPTLPGALAQVWRALRARLGSGRGGAPDRDQ